MTIARKTWFAVALFAMAVSQSASAQNITDQYWGATPPGGYTDVVSGAGDTRFNIDSMDVTRSGTSLTVKINTNFSGANNGSLNAYFGDLFLSSNWTPDITAANYANDDAASGTKWTYGFALDGRDTIANHGAVGSITGDSAGTGTLYDLASDGILANADNAYLSNTYFSSGYRVGQEVVVKDTSDDVATGTWESKSGYISFTFDVGGTALEYGDIALHWAMTCANDVIEGEVSAPAILLLMAMGLFGVGASSKLRKRKLA